MLNKYYRLFGKVVLVLTIVYFAGCASSTQIGQEEKLIKSSGDDIYSWINLDTVKAGRFDTGKMWTFEYPPTDYFKEEYNFTPTEDWYNHVRMAALRFANYCSASFVSEDGLVMTNHHCGRQSITEVSKEGEDLHETGFFSPTLEDERPVPGLYVDQLVLIKDVTDEIQKAMDEGKTEEEKLSNRKNKISEIQKSYKEDTGLEVSITTLFNGGKYSLYGYKRYNDVRLVFAPETHLGFFGGDPDNFTYPRYNLDATFFRVYDEEGKPLKTEHYYKWSPNGAVAGDPVFIVGNPGRTNRLNTVAQLEYQRDIQYPLTMDLLNALVQIYTEILKEQPERAYELQDNLFEFANSQKAYNGILKGLRDPILMQKKKDFEKNFKNAVQSNPGLNAKYGDLWDKITSTRNEIRKYSKENAAYGMNPLSTSAYFFNAKKIVDIANNLKLPEDEQKAEYKGSSLDTTITALIEQEVDKVLRDKLLLFNIQYLTNLLGEEHPVVKKLTGGKKGKAAFDYCLSKSVITNAEKTIALFKKGPDAVLNSDDPFIYYIVNTQDKGKELSKKIKEIATTESDYVQQLGRAVFEVYGTSIPPDATFTLRLADGVVKGFEYNGTTAPVMTTFYGLYDRFYSHNKKFPWNLPEKWLNPPPEFELHTPFNFVSTNDIIGGNSGSPVINKNAEIVGLVFDGNIESLPGQFIFDTEYNRSVSVHSAGLLEAIQDLYKVKRISDELKNGKITP
ncbi:MAG TPA: S46 family peptidase [Ignavibacteriaceae bacterium]|nr:S46 family peptidase [Ignavibacteriaceae bacterium]